MIKTNLRGRIKNTSLPFARGLLPVFEAVQNSIHAIEETKRRDGRIVVEIDREPLSQAALRYDGNSQKAGAEARPEIAGFKIRDNGVGFTDKHMMSFETLDSDLKAEAGGRGVGRLLWLKAFKQARVTSTYDGDGGKRFTRQFTFSVASGLKSTKPREAAPQSAVETTVALEEFDPLYRDASRKTAEAIANSLFEHCLWYFVRDGGVCAILVKDEEEVINLHDVYDAHMHRSARNEAVTIRDKLFELTHIKLRSTTSKKHFIGWCASNRLVDEEPIEGKIAGLYGKLEENAESFIYACYVTSKYLDARVRPERTGFVLEKTSSGGLLGELEVAEDELRATVLEAAERYLADYLVVSRQAGLARVQEFVEKRNPRYRPFLSRIPEAELYIDPKTTDRDLDIILHKHKSAAESRLLSEGHELMKPMADDKLTDYEARLYEYLRLAEDIRKSDLAEYVFHRKVILDLLGVAIQRTEDGKYSREDLIHELVMPLRTTSNSAEFERNNLWLIDERLAFHNFLASDKALRELPITNSDELRRPDLIALNVYDEPLLISEKLDLPLGTIVVVEIKRPMRNDASAGEENDPIEQALGYLDRVRKGEVLTASGRQIPNSPSIPGFCYVICDLTPSVKRRCEVSGLTATSDYMGYFGYNPNYKAYIEVISFDRLLNGARERNRAFFDRLGLPT